MGVRKFSARPPAHARQSLAARGRFLPAFGGQAMVVALTLLALGSYLLGDQFANPLQAHEVGLLFASVLITSAGGLLYCLFYPAGRVRHHIIVRTELISPWNDRGLAPTEHRKLAWHEAREKHSPQHRYVDHARIRV